MNVTILTSSPFLNFVWRIVIRYPEHDFVVWTDGPYDWIDECDLAISFMYPYKVPAEHLDKAQINFHPGPLPRYKGRNLCYWAIVEGATEFGATVHYMDETFDTGDIIECREFPIEPHWCSDDLHEKTIRVSQELFREYLPRILAGEEFPRTKNEGGVYYGKTEIDEEIYLTKETKDRIRAITYYFDFLPKITINGIVYRIIRE